VNYKSLVAVSSSRQITGVIQDDSDTKTRTGLDFLTPSPANYHS